MKCSYFTDFIQAHNEKSDVNRIFIDKMFTKEVCVAAGLETATQYFISKSIDEIDCDKLPDPVVLKLTGLSSKSGIYILYKIKGGYFEQLSKRLLTFQEIKNEINNLTKGKSSPVIAEEVIVGENSSLQIPFDYKIYVFNENPEFILQINRNKKKDEIAFFDGEFKPMLDSRAQAPGDVSVLGTHLIPKNYQKMLVDATIAAKKLNRPFISVDMYTNGDKCYVGELTPTPGGPYYGRIVKFSDDFDRYLGKLMIKGYESRGWAIPEIQNYAPGRRG